MMPSPEILGLLCLGLLCWAIGASLAAWKWRRSYHRALAAFRAFKSMRFARHTMPAKSVPHVKAARTRAERARALVLEGMKQLQADIHAAAPGIRGKPESLRHPPQGELGW
jgi:hypothetical protein